MLQFVFDPLMITNKKARYRLLHALLEANINMNVNDEESGGNAGFWSMNNRDITGLKCILDTGYFSSKSTNGIGNTLLCTAMELILEKDNEIVCTLRIHIVL